MTHYFLKPRTRKYIKGYGSFARNLSNKYGKQLLDTATKTVIYGSKKVIHKAAEATDRWICMKKKKKIADAVAKSYDNKIVKLDKNSRNIEEIIIPPENYENTMKYLRNTIKYLNYYKNYLYQSLWKVSG